MIDKLKIYIEATKPRLTRMAVMTGMIGYVLGEVQADQFNWWGFLAVTIGLVFCGASANILNEAVEYKNDALMERTKGRPIPTGRLPVKGAYIVGIICGVIGVVELLLTAPNYQAGLLAFVTIFSYVVIYTLSKTKTIFNTVIGAFPGALPILIGWVMSTGGYHFYGFVFFFILFIWQFPHFFAICWIYREDYKRGGYKMASFYDSEGKGVVWLIFVSNLALIAVSWLPCAIKGMVSDVYFFFNVVATAYLLAKSLVLFVDRDKFMRGYFLASVFYLPVALIFLTVDFCVI